MQNEEIFDYAIWVDRTDHLPTEDPSSMSIEQWMCDYTIDNNGSLERLERNVDILIKTIFKNQGVNHPASTVRRLSELIADSLHK